MVGGFTNFLQIVLLQDKQDVEVPTRVIPNLQNVCQSLSLCTNYTISLCLGYTLFMQYLNIYIYIYSTTSEEEAQSLYSETVSAYKV